MILDKGYVNVTPFSKENFQSATDKYYKLEKMIEQNKNVVVLVATSSYKSLREAYPSYFSDISEFIDSLEKVEANCKRFGLT